MLGLVQAALAVAWWYDALSISIGLLGADDFRGGLLWAIFLGLVLGSVTTHARIITRGPAGRG